jgi:hypothetical protein
MSRTKNGGRVKRRPPDPMQDRRQPCELYARNLCCQQARTALAEPKEGEQLCLFRLKTR